MDRDPMIMRAIALLGAGLMIAAGAAFLTAGYLAQAGEFQPEPIGPSIIYSPGGER
jgi:hypothetical protein